MKLLSQSNKFQTLVFAICMIASCSSKVRRIAHAPNNPTEYCYNASLNEVKAAIVKEFLLMPGYRYMRLEYRGKDVILSSKAEQIFKIKSNENDFYLNYSGSIGKSKIYFDKNGKALDYFVEFHLHLIPLNESYTKVEIKTIDPKVGVGRETLPSLPHLVRMIKTKSVPPSSIEEYEILLKIGKGLCLGKNMPALK